MALCALMAHWKTFSRNSGYDSSGFVEGLLAIIVDHGLRPESKEEAETVSHWVSDMGIRYEIVHCDWPDGQPKVGHLEEDARDLRYKIFQDVCLQNQIGVLLTAHHADDQAELFILRLSRNSGVLGLAGMASTSQLFPKYPYFISNSSDSQGILLVRPLMEFSKEDLYKICVTNNHRWVEDPTNRSSLFARNRIRTALQDLKTCGFRSELQELIAICRRTRLYVDRMCQVMLDQAVTIMPHGYAVIDLESLNPSKRDDICLSRFLAVILQFISQRHRPVRGSASRLLLDYIRTVPCKTSFTASGCYLCTAPRTKGAKVIVCCSVQSTIPGKIELNSTCVGQGRKQCFLYDVERIVSDQKSQLEHMVPDPSHVCFLDVVSPNSVLDEARRLEMICESTYDSILRLQITEKELFHSKSDVTFSSELKNKVESGHLEEAFRPGQSCYFMSRFLFTWMPNQEFHSSCNTLEDCKKTRHEHCSVCMAANMVAYIRHMIEEDWLFLAKLSKAENLFEFKHQKFMLYDEKEQMINDIRFFSKYARSSAQDAIKTLKSIPVAARRALPVVVSVEGFLLSIPSIGFKYCPSLEISAEFRPRVPLGGGHTSFA
ncbi:uncharacterized protein LOC130824584 isoform X2 [Amaranthus tricolor]|nr:uncharacterized protein LOC130824584 isoform X2 [Amaranthus tricolor]